MSGMFNTKRQKIPKQPEQVAFVEEEPEEARKRERKRLIAGGRQSTILGGLQNAMAAALKRRLGE